VCRPGRCCGLLGAGREGRGASSRSGGGGEGRGACDSRQSLKEAYFGEQHLHTAYSLDAYIGGARLTPSDAYRFAKARPSRSTA